MAQEPLSAMLNIAKRVLFSSPLQSLLNHFQEHDLSFSFCDLKKVIFDLVSTCYFGSTDTKRGFSYQDLQTITFFYLCLPGVTFTGKV